MYRPNQDCIYIADRGQCNHLDRGRGFLWAGKDCVLEESFPSECRKRIRASDPEGDKPPASE